jgi:hypothetical protein
MLRRLGAFFDRVPVAGTPPVQACRRMGLPGNYLHKRAVN